MKTKNTFKRMSWAALPFLLLTTGCGENNASDEVEGHDDLVELQVNPGVAALTRSAIQGSTAAETGGLDATKLNSIAVYAQCANINTAAKNNNYGLYSREGNKSTWVNNGDVKIYLTSEDATVYAYHPAYQPNGTTKAFQSSGTALTISGDVTATSTIPVSVYQGALSGDDANCTITALENADKKWNNTSWVANADQDLIASAPGEVDYMWATANPTQVDNGKGTSPKGSSTVLTMNHALAMVSFRIYNDGTYHNAGALTQIKLVNKSGTVLSAGTNPTMKITDGTITPGAAVAATFIRKVTYTLITVAQTASAAAAVDETGAKAAAKKFSMLVMPETVATDKTNIQAVFTIDGINYDVPLAKSGTSQWEKGKNYLYTVKLSGKQLTITSVTVVPWSAQAGGDLDIQ